MGLLFLPPWPTRTGLCPLLPLLLPLRKKRALVFLFLLEKLALLVVSRHIIMKDVHRESHTYTKTHTGRWFGRLVWLIGLDQRLKKSQRQVSPSNTRQSYQNELFSGRESFRVLFLQRSVLSGQLRRDTHGIHHRHLPILHSSKSWRKYVVFPGHDGHTHNLRSCVDCSFSRKKSCPQTVYMVVWLFSRASSKCICFTDSVVLLHSIPIAFSFSIKKCMRTLTK